MSVLRINEKRFLRRMNEMAKVGAVTGGGVHRLALSDEDKRARDKLKGWMLNAGLMVDIDQIGNMYGLRKGTNAQMSPVAFGSHLDTVGYGGRFDGALGVMAALEVLETLNDNKIETNASLCMVNFTNEEGARFAPDMMGNIIVKGTSLVSDAWEARDLKDPSIRLKDELEKIGYLGSLDPTSFRPGSFIELHIEQGPILEMGKRKIGVVEKVQGINWIEFQITGQSNHAGTTPMELRKDAGLVAARIASFCRELTSEFPALRATAGLMEFSPNLINVVAGKARITVDLRSPDREVIRGAENSLMHFAREAALIENCRLESKNLTLVDPVDFDFNIIKSIENNTNKLGYTFKRMMSGAGHDAQLMAGVCPAAMIFIPSKNGISHSVEEFSSEEDTIAGANVLLNSVLEQATGK
jgi:beta-ureidopropionase / N-carbamoyl-L-amino-acid hydrolase